MTEPVRTAIILAAGQGSRLREAQSYKPLCPVGGVSLLKHALTGLYHAGLAEALVVTGYAGETIEQYIDAGDWPIAARTVRNHNWQAPNGISALVAGRTMADASALLLMCDHLVDPEIYRRMKNAGAGPGLRLAIDRDLGSDLVDPLDVTCVRTEGERIAAIGKGLEPHDCYDAGVFAVGAPFFDTLAALDDPSISDGVNALVASGEAEIVDCTGLDWVDVDDAAALAKAERLLASAPWNLSQS